MLVLAERLRATNGGSLDESAIQAVAEATGVPTEYVRLAHKLRTERQKKSFLSNARAQFMTLEPEVRRSVISGITASLCALLHVIEVRLTMGTANHYAVFDMLALVALTAGLYNICVSKDAKVAAIGGAVFGGGFFAMNALFSMFLGVPARIEALGLIGFTLLGAVAGLLLFRVVEKYRPQLGLVDPVKERQELLRQLHELRERLESGERSMTFLSVDIVGSTRMKTLSDPLSVEFTFNEYHQFVDRVTRKHGGAVHSTAGDGVTCAFDHPQSAFAAAKNVQTEIMELNAFRNKVGVPIVLRCGIHSGSVVAPSADDITSLNFAHVIDVAAHIQKACPPGSIAVSEMASTGISEGAGSVGTEWIEVEGTRAVVWSPRHAAGVVAAGPPPPTPQSP